MNFYFEIYTKDPQTGHGGYDISTGYVINADDSRQAIKAIKGKFEFFDEIIDIHESIVPATAHTVIDCREGRYPFAFVQHGKHGDTILVANDFEEEKKCWLAIFEVINVWGGYYRVQDMGEDERSWYEQAVLGDWQAARTLLDFRNDREYERLTTECLQTDDQILKKLEEDRNKARKFA